MDGRHLLDFRIGTPWSDAQLSLLARSAAGGWANPLHPASEGRRAATWLEAASATVRQLTGLPHVTFYSGRQAALHAVINAHPDLRITTSATNRKPVLAMADEVVPVDAEGRSDWPRAALAIMQGANEETGVIDAVPTSDVVVLDASNSFGRVPGVPEVDYVIADAAAWGAPGGIAFVAGHRALPVEEVPPLPLIALAVQTLAEQWSAVAPRATAMSAAMQQFEAEVLTRVPDVQFHGDRPAPHMRSFSVLHLDAETLMRALDEAGYVVGSGSACVHDGTPSHVLAAMGRVTHGNIRLALPVEVAPEILADFAAALEITVARLRREAGVEHL